MLKTARAAAECLRRLRIVPARSASIEFEQDLRMLDLLGRRPAFADHLRQRRLFLFGKPHNILDCQRRGADIGRRNTG